MCTGAAFVAGGIYAIDRLFPRVFHGKSVVMEGRLATSDRSREVVARIAPALSAPLAQKGHALGAPLLVRIFKEPKELEVWLLDKASGRFALFRTYPIRKYSGALGPKLKEGDGQAPEGFYSVTPERMNPLSRFHLSFDVGYPNDFDRSLGRTGSAIMVHGGGMSIGCFAMGDEAIEEIYTLAESALRNGQSTFSVHIFPFRMTDAMMKAHEGSHWLDFWRNLKEGYDYFENKGMPGDVVVEGGRYALRDPR